MIKDKNHQKFVMDNSHDFYLMYDTNIETNEYDFIEFKDSNGEDNQDEVLMAEAIASISLPPEAISDLDLATNYQEVVISWQSDNEDVITNQGVVARGSTDKTVTLTATFTYKTLEEIKNKS